MITSFFAPKTGSEKGKRNRNDVDYAEEVSKRLKDNNDHGKNNEVAKLLLHLDDTDNTATTSWKKALEKHFSSAAFGKLALFVSKERSIYTVYPPLCDTWSALNLTPLETVKVVIVGQDPYHGPGQAHGLCFSVFPGQPVPPSLKNIYKELKEDPQIDFEVPNHGHLSRWARQGVLMINTVLTVRKSEANSHKNRGWELTTDEILRAVDRHSRINGEGVVFLLWGKPAAYKAQALVSNVAHTIISTSHPSPLGATKTSSPFLGSRCFSRCNDALRKMGLKEIDWNVDGSL